MASDEATRAAEAAVDQVACDLRDYGVGFVLFPKSTTTVQIVGSGTLVFLNGRPAILTADHVVEALPRSGRVGLMCPTIDNDETFCPKLQMEYAISVRVPRGAHPEIGPDLAVLFLPPDVAATLQAKKSFFNLDRRREAMLADPPKLDDGAWLLCGAAAVWATEEVVDGHPRSFLDWKCGVSLPMESKDREGFDYVMVPTRVGKNTDTPETFGGYSGGGLWHVALTGTKGSVQAEPVLCGIAFFETESQGADRFVRCHFCQRRVYE